MKKESVQIANLQSLYRIDRRRIERLALCVLSAEKIRKSIGIALVDDHHIRQLNRRFLGRNRPTDVLAFNLEDDLPESEGFLGEVVVSVERAIRQAKKRTIPIIKELELYIVHGILHLAGYDDVTREQALVMREREAEILARFNAGAK